MLVALVAGLVAGLLAGGRVSNLAVLSFRWGPLAVTGLLAQVVLFSTPVGDALGALAPACYVATTAPGTTRIVVRAHAAVAAFLCEDESMAMDALERELGRRAKSLAQSARRRAFHGRVASDGAKPSLSPRAHALGACFPR